MRHKVIRFYQVFFIFALVVVFLHVYLFVSPLPVTGKVIDSSSSFSSVRVLFPFVSLGLLLLLVVFLKIVRTHLSPRRLIPLQVRGLSHV